MTKNFRDATETEDMAIANDEAVMFAKKEQVGTLQAQIEVEMEHVGCLDLEIVEFETDIEDALDTEKSKKAETSEELREMMKRQHDVSGWTASPHSCAADRLVGQAPSTRST
mmetsp:Transcript_100026/g.320867  ORF Transcript_100026/g.320867 Transcript_100026/m.320867 type:complete len:112 (+) Transcript_100026:443-778(+)